MIIPMDRLPKKLTKEQQEENFKKVLASKLQESYYRGIVNGSHMQCGTILDVYKKKLDETPKLKQTKAFLAELLKDIFYFCELGKSTEMSMFEKLINGDDEDDETEEV